MANASKWERTIIKPAKPGEEKPDWRNTKKLGSLLGDEEDIERRKVLASASFKSLRSLWQQKGVTSIKTRMEAYNALSLPVLLYNSATWGVTDKVLEKLGSLGVFHRRQLREVLGVETREMRSEDLYKRCGTTPQALHERIVLARWSLFDRTCLKNGKRHARTACYGQVA